MEIFLCSSQPTVQLDPVGDIMGPLRQNFIVVASSEQEVRELLKDDGFNENELEYFIFQKIPFDEKSVQFCGLESLNNQKVQMICEQNGWSRAAYILEA